MTLKQFTLYSGNIPGYSWAIYTKITDTGKVETKGQISFHRSTCCSNNILVEHHTKYKEIHGHDETIWMGVGAHRQLHNRLRNEGKCNIPVKELQKISKAASGRTIKKKEKDKRYIRKKYESGKIYGLKNYKTVTLNDHIGTNIRLKESIRYNKQTGNIYIGIQFEATGLHKLYVIEER